MERIWSELPLHVQARLIGEGVSLDPILLKLREAASSHAPPASGNRSQPIAKRTDDRPQPIRRDIARLLDNLYGLHVRPGHIDAVLEVFQLHSPVKVPLAQPSPSVSGEALRALVAALKDEIAGCSIHGLPADRVHRALRRLESAISSSVRDAAAIVTGRQFYELMQAYRHTPPQNIVAVQEAYEAVQNYLQAALAPLGESR